MLFTVNHLISRFLNKLTVTSKEIFSEIANYVSLPKISESNKIMTERPISICSKNLFL